METNVTKSFKPNLATMNIYKQVIERERKHWEQENIQRIAALEEITAKAKKVDLAAAELRKEVAEMEAEIIEREACEEKVQEYVKTLLQ